MKKKLFSIVPFHISKALNDLGLKFSDIYSFDNEWASFRNDPDIIVYWNLVKNEYTDNQAWNFLGIPATTYEETLNWIWENYGLCIIAKPSEYKSWSLEIFDDKGECLRSRLGFNDQLAAINYGITEYLNELIKEKYGNSK